MGKTGFEITENFLVSLLEKWKITKLNKSNLKSFSTARETLKEKDNPQMGENGYDKI